MLAEHRNGIHAQHVLNLFKDSLTLCTSRVGCNFGGIGRNTLPEDGNERTIRFTAMRWTAVRDALRNSRMINVNSPR